MKSGREVCQLGLRNGRADEDAAERVPDEGDASRSAGVSRAVRLRLLPDVAQDLVDQALGHGLEAGEGVALVHLGHEEVQVGGRQRHLQVGLYEAEVGRVAVQPVDAHHHVRGAGGLAGRKHVAEIVAQVEVGDGGGKAGQVARGQTTSQV